jgi:hypothetical protein
MNELVEMIYPLAELSGKIESGKTELAKMCSAIADAMGRKGRSKKFCGETILGMGQGKYNYNERIREVVRWTVSEYGLVPFDDSDGVLDALDKIDSAKHEASRVLAETRDQNHWESALAPVRKDIVRLMNQFKRDEDQIKHAFPEAKARGPEDSFNGLVWSAGVHFVVGTAGYAAYHVDEEVRYRLSVLGQSPSPFVQNWLDSVESDIGAGFDRVHTIGLLAKTFEKAGTNFDGAARLAADNEHRVFCANLAAKARLNAQSLRQEMKDIAANLRGYGGYGPDAVREAGRLDREYERRIAHLSMGERLQRASRDALALTQLRPNDPTPLRLIVYEAILAEEVGVRTVKKLLPSLAKAMGCSEKDVLTQRPQRAQEMLPLLEEPALQNAFRSCAGLAELVSTPSPPTRPVSLQAPTNSVDCASDGSPSNSNLNRYFPKARALSLILVALGVTVAGIPTQAGNRRVATVPVLTSDADISARLIANWGRLGEVAPGIRTPSGPVRIAGNQPGTGPIGLTDLDTEPSRNENEPTFKTITSPAVMIAQRPGTGPIG